MRRLASCVTSSTHRLYPSFMAQLSGTIFEFDPDDLKALITAKAAELRERGFSNVTDPVVTRHLTRSEYKRHCRRRTRGAETTLELLGGLLEQLKDEVDLLGVPLFHKDKLVKTWEVQKHHLRCIQDPPGIPLYTVLPMSPDARIRLPSYRCNRGSTSLESFHLHLNRFIPGNNTLFCCSSSFY